MKKLFYTLALVWFIQCTFTIEKCMSQWQPDVRLTNNTAESQSSYNNAWSVASSGSVIHVVWRDMRDGNWEIYYKRSTNDGISWGADTRLTNNTSFSQYPSITVSGSVVHVIWKDNRDGNQEIYYKRSTDAGINWGVDTRLTNDNSASSFPSIAVSGLIVYAVWEDNRDGNNEIYYKRSIDAGVSWGADIRLTNDIFYSQYVSIAVSGFVVHIVWWDNRDANWEIYYKRSTDAGLNWGADTRLTNNTATSLNPTVTVSGQLVHVVWNDTRDGNYEIYYKRSTDAGVSWGTDTRLSNNTFFSSNPSVAVSGLFVHVVWDDNRDGNWEIYHKRSQDGGINWGTDTRLTNDTALYSIHPSVTVSGQVAHVVWTDNRDGNYEIYYKRDPTGNIVGITNINSGIPSSFSLSQNYPNPFNPTTKIKFNLVKISDVKITVYNIMGREVQTLVNENLQPGTYEASFDGSRLTSGVYFYKLSTEEFSSVKKMIMLK